MSEYRRLANAVRALSMHGVQQANSGHPGAPLGMADMAEALWRGFMRHNPRNPLWPDRDRFVLSNGHASMMLYALLHLSGYDLSLDELRRFRQLGSRTPGHPEYRVVPGVETTTGPLGQGLGNAVGFAMAEAMLASEFNRSGHVIVDHYTYVFMGDGCLMEGISHEACSLAGTLGLGKLIALYDFNGISIDGAIDDWFADDTARRFEGYHWHVITLADGNDGAQLRTALTEARAERERPTLIICPTTIGYGSPNKQGRSAAHGAPLGEDEVRLTAEALEWEYGPFEIPRDIYAAWDATDSGQRLEDDWQRRFDAFAADCPALAAEFRRRMNGILPDGLSDAAMKRAGALEQDAATLATRQAGQRALDFFAARVPELVGGSADLAPSDLTISQASVAIGPQRLAGNYIHWGVREFAMAAAMNGLQLHGGYRPYGGTFLVFSDYARSAIRMAALMQLGVIYVFTHDSIGVGEDGPTHQPVEQLASLRLIPGLDVWRPCDQVETLLAWEQMLARSDGPSAVVLTRQPLEQMPRSGSALQAICRGGYVLYDAGGPPQLILLATGSEVALAYHAALELARDGVAVRVVSMPCTSVFDRQERSYREQVLPPAVRARVAVEAGSSRIWHQYTGLDGQVLGLDHYGESAPASILFERYGFTVARVVEAGRAVLGAAATPRGGG